MLRSLHISHYVLIDSLEVDFPKGLVIITGQTGAGKSILLGALSLLMGGKADASVISEGAENCVVEGVFSTDDLAVKAILDENDVEWEGGELIIRRTVSASGRSRSFINDSPVTVGVLTSVASHLVDIHSQHQSLLLCDPKFQLRILDSFAGDAALAQDCAAAWTSLQALSRELSQAQESLSRADEEREYYLARLEQLERGNLREGELEELEVEQKQLANAEGIKENLYAAESLLGGEQSISSVLKETSFHLSKVSSYVPELSELAERLDSSRIEIDDILSEIEIANSRIDVSAERLEAVEERMSFLYGLLKKHGCASVEELIAKRDSYSSRLADTSSLEERVEYLRGAVKTAQSKYDALALELRKARRAATAPLSEAVTGSLRALELDRALFSVTLSEAQPSARGIDEIHFQFSATGTNPTDVSKCASGGEISRIMLCLKSLLARYSSMPTMIFDDIDTGVSGSVADKMGSMICAMGSTMQVFAITHLPQVAAKGEAHYLVSKSVDGGKTTSTVEKIEGDARLHEIARLLSGSTITPEAIANAKTLL